MDAHRPLRFYTALAITALLATVFIVVLTNRAADERANRASLDHAPSVCLIGVLKQITAASGQPAEVSRRNFSIVFTPEWLAKNCRLTDEEIAVVLEPASPAPPGTTTTLP